MPGAPFDDTSYERELARLAYSRPVDGVDPAAAQAQLAALAESRTPPPAIEWRLPRLPAVATRREKLLIATAVAAALVVASALAIAPVSSLAVFATTQSGAPAWPGTVEQDGSKDRIRWLTSSNGWDVFAFITTGGNICMASFSGSTSAGGACTSQEVFRSIGLRLGMSRLVGNATEQLNVTWGPTGGARVSDHPLAAWGG